ncbi:CDC24 [Candida pseudojiufengensis]|uniref:CDC24 n=1 Tax=Candida pseudojiufengensis TaxID=497109 RepID=UPI002224C37F|nr:CDC24 [Candida pseudojiufengensis]KAI5964187.1 CDC24 [Candida pseudojiufengensis]
MVESHPPQPFRSFSTNSSISLNSSSNNNNNNNNNTNNGSTQSISRINSSGPLNLNNFNKQSSPKDHLFFKCEYLKKKLNKIDGMLPFMKLAYLNAEKLCEQQSLYLSQEKFNLSMNRLSITSDNSQSSGGNGLHQTNTNSSSGNTTFNSNSTNNSESLLTYTAGVLPSNINVDPATQLWKLFQQGAPLCLIFNYISPDHKISVVSSDDLRICKKSVYDFIIAMKLNLKIEDDELFTISNVYSDNTNDLIKIVDVITKILNTHSLSRKNSVSDLTTNVNQEEEINLDVTITDERSKVFREIIETERKYVQDLELLIKYRNELIEAELLSSEQIHTLFPNLNEIVDFQRKFLNGLECNINVPIKNQRIGSVFIHASLGPFKAYEPWTIGQLTAIDLINKEIINLKKSSILIDPGFELQSYILKPIQRLCKYPLLLTELIKTSPESSTTNKQDNNETSSFKELIMARSAMKEVANQVNEAQRRAENVEYLNKLMERVNNWRGFNLRDQGELLYHGIVGVKDSDTEKEYVAYLFEKIIFFFVDLDKLNSEKENAKSEKRKFGSRKKSNANITQSTSNLLESINGKNDKSPLELKGRVYIQEIYNISASASTSSSSSSSSMLNQGYTLIISWSGKKESGSFTLKYRTEEMRNQWETCLRNLKTNEMNNHINKKLRDSQSSTNTNDSSIYDYIGNVSDSLNTFQQQQQQPPTNNNEQRSSNGSRHHSSSSTFSMMRNNSRSKSAGSIGGIDTSTSRLSSSSTTSTTPLSSSLSQQSQPPQKLPFFEISIKLIYNNYNLQQDLLVNSYITFNELYLKINKIINTSLSEENSIIINKLRYKDEDGDFVVLDSQDDWSLALDELNDDKNLSIFVI